MTERKLFRRRARELFVLLTSQKIRGGGRDDRGKIPGKIEIPSPGLFRVLRAD
jgi:hypothetical protein